MIFTTFNAVYHYVEDGDLRIVFVNPKEDQEWLDLFVSNIHALPITVEKAKELLEEGCTFQFSAGCLVSFGERVQ